ncbi:hypothetical protein MKP08_12155 [Erythrobacter sp. LQ02-29]|uniref:ArnT family glycosyltransferase n=1 Tax=Erythrobacter sp. LQ02-29 TaxID=2920384 RepID=UPI001F4EB5CE|nr:hypothetical protein [Erythrobacter sp. LQ02-29]MCP9223499.1 hypothetical protein [Erythrobacter sp. LQ02-29]
MTFPLMRDRHLDAETPPQTRRNWQAFLQPPARPWYADWRLLLVLIAFTAVTRAASFGSPVISNDEEFYLLVGSRMLHGALPYIDIWDRKPVGLFLIYASTSALGPFQVIQYQIAACLSAGCTAWVLYRIARMIAPAGGALIAAACYPIMLAGFSQIGGQAPVFYNLPVAIAAWWIARRYRDGDTRKLFAGGCGIMLLLGIAMQIKYTVMFEGMCFGLALMWLAHVHGLHRGRIVPMAVAWVACALLPTAAAMAAYAAIGHLDEFVFANFVSIFSRESGMMKAVRRLAILTFFLSPLWVLLLWAPRRLGLRGNGSPQLAFIKAWAIAAFVGFLLIGTYYDHYVGPLLVPFLVLGARALGWQGVRRRFAIGTLAFITICTAIHVPIRIHLAGNRDQFRTVAAAIERQLGPDGCLYIHEGEPGLYHATGACTVTRYLFTTHLNSLKEQHALGIDTAAEMRHIVAQRPQVIVKAVEPYSDPPNRPARAIMDRALARDYRETGRYQLGVHTLEIWRLRDR